jgi:serine/threonine protein kinase
MSGDIFVESCSTVESIGWIEPDTPRPSLNMIDEECFSKAKLDLTEALRRRYPKMDSPAIKQVIQKASDIFRDSQAKPDHPDPITTDDNHNAASETTSMYMNTTQYARGAVCYRAPEMIGEDPGFNNRTDIWALGCWGYEMSTGSKLFRDDLSPHSKTTTSTTAIRGFSTAGSAYPWEIQANCRICKQNCQCGFYDRGWEQKKKSHQLSPKTLQTPSTQSSAFPAILRLPAWPLPTG